MSIHCVAYGKAHQLVLDYLMPEQFDLAFYLKVDLWFCYFA